MEQLIMRNNRLRFQLWEAFTDLLSTVDSINFSTQANVSGLCKTKPNILLKQAIEKSV